jgi:hypothetical protein
MWLWDWELHQVGFRCRSEGYWQCEVGHGLPDDCYLSLFVHHSGRARNGRGPGRRPLEVSAFHVTFLLGVDRIHFYYHEVAENAWEPGGHTSSGEILRHGVEPHALRDEADVIAARLVAALGGAWRPRRYPAGSLE